MAWITKKPCFPSFSAALAPFSKCVVRLVSSRAMAEGRSFLRRSRYSLMRRLASSTSSARTSSEGLWSIFCKSCLSQSKSLPSGILFILSALRLGFLRARAYSAFQNAPKPSEHRTQLWIPLLGPMLHSLKSASLNADPAGHAVKTGVTFPYDALVLPLDDDRKCEIKRAPSKVRRPRNSGHWVYFRNVPNLDLPQLP